MPGRRCSDCLTSAEVATAKAFYSGPEDHAGKPTYYGWAPGSEFGPFNWGFLEAPVNAPGEPSFDGLFKWVFGKDWDWRKFDLDRDMPKVDAELGPILNGAATGDFSKFHGARRQAHHLPGLGRSDRLALSDRRAVQRAQRQVRRRRGDAEVRQALHGSRRRPLRHWGADLTPSIPPTIGAPPPPSTDADHDLFTALARWVEDGVAPSHVIATSYVGNDASKGIAMQRPLCPHPQKAWYKGGGDPDIAAKFHLRC